MIGRWIRFVLVALACASPSIIAPSVLAQAAQNITLDMELAAENVYVFMPSELGVGNCTAIVRTEDVVLVDTSATPSLGRKVIEGIKAITDLPVRFVINTHWHDDHVWGNQAIAKEFPEAVFIAHEETLNGIRSKALPGLQANIERLGERVAEREAMLESGRTADDRPLSDAERDRIQARVDLFQAVREDMLQIDPTFPRVTLTNKLTLHGATTEDDELRVLAFGRGHTSGDVIVHVPGKCVIMGDLLTLPFPAAAEAYLSDWITTLEQIGNLGERVLVPGHGPVQRGTEYLNRFINLLSSVVAQTQEAVRKDLTPDEIIDGLRADAFTSHFPADESARLMQGFEVFFLQPAVESILRELEEESDSNP